MPIAPDKRHYYGKEWRAVREPILARAGNRCEWCGAPNHDLICRRRNNPAEWVLLSDLLTGESEEESWFFTYFDEIKVVLTVAHLNHNPADNRPENLAALCQRCHLLHDVKEHLASRRKSAAARGGQGVLLQEEAA